MDRQDELTITELLSQRHEDLERIARLLDSYLRTACGQLELTLKDFRMRLVDAPRVKPASSAIRALDESGSSSAEIWNIDDIVGLRIVVGMRSDAQSLADCLMADPNSPLVNTSRDDMYVEESGYRAIHIKGHYPATFAAVGCEIQIRTMLQDAWAIASRYDLYRRQDTPEILKEMARIEAMHLEAAGTALESIRAQVNAAEPAAPIVSRQDEQPSPSVEPVEHVEEHDEDDDFVIRSSLSTERVESFLESYLEDRQQTETLRFLFHRVGAFELSDDLPSEPRGFNMLLLKGPFVKGSRWVPYFTREFATAAERGLLHCFHEHLDQLELRPGLTATWSDPRPTIGALWEEGKRHHPRFEPSLIVIGGPLPERWLIEMVRWATPRWQLPQELQRLAWVEGSVGDIPVLLIRDSSGPSTISLLDLSQFAILKRSTKAVQSFSIHEFSEEEAMEFVEAHPEAFSTDASFDDKLRIIRLRVLLNLFENYHLDIKDQTFGLRVLIDED